MSGAVCVCGGGWGGGELWERTFQIILTSLNQMQLSYFPNTATWDKAHVCTNTNILVGSKTRAHVLGNGIEIIYDLVFSILDALPPGILHTGGPSLWGYPQKLSALLKLIFIGVQLLYNVLLVPAVQQSESVTRTHTAPLPWLSFPFRSLHNTGFPVLYSGFSLVVYFIHGSVYMSIPIPQSIPMSWGDFLVLFWSHFCRLIQLKKKTT